MPTVKHIHEMELGARMVIGIALVSFTKSEIPPEWENLNNLHSRTLQQIHQISFKRGMKHM